MTVAGVSQTALARFYGLKGPQREPVRLQEAGGLTAISGVQPTDVEDARRFKWRGIRESRTWDHWAVGAAGHDQENKCEKDAHTIIPNHYATNQPFVYWTKKIRKVNRLTHIDYIYWQSESTLN